MEDHSDYSDTAHFTPFALRLIDLVKQHPILYVKTPRTNKMFLEKITIWEQIAQTLETPANKCKTKWRQIRDNYRRFTKSTKDGKSKYNDERLNFLKDFQNDDSSEVNLATEPTDDDVEIPDYIRPKKRKLADKLLEELSTQRSERFQLLKSLMAENQSTAKKSPPESPIHSFFRSMADVVVGFPPYMIAETRMEVCNLVTRMDLRNEAQKGAIPGVPKIRIPAKANMPNVIVKNNLLQVDDNAQDRIQSIHIEIPKMVKNIAKEKKLLKNVTVVGNATEN